MLIAGLGLLRSASIAQRVRRPREHRRPRCRRRVLPRRPRAPRILRSATTEVSVGLPIVFAQLRVHSARPPAGRSASLLAFLSEALGVYGLRWHGGRGCSSSRRSPGSSSTLASHQQQARSEARDHRAAGRHNRLAIAAISAHVGRCVGRMTLLPAYRYPPPSDDRSVGVHPSVPGLGSDPDPVGHHRAYLALLVLAVAGDLVLAARDARARLGPAVATATTLALAVCRCAFRAGARDHRVDAVADRQDDDEMPSRCRLGMTGPDQSPAPHRDQRRRVRGGRSRRSRRSSIEGRPAR